MENLTVELDGIKYLIMERTVTAKNAVQMENRCQKHECIQQGIIELHPGGLFSSRYATFRILVPEHNIVAFSKDEKWE